MSQQRTVIRLPSGQANTQLMATNLNQAHPTGGKVELEPDHGVVIG